ncbi:hypothetical protein T484DRAFT_1786972 [Baffinella frigidus]|nr:hypothetical protein T484DRAFT_1786972 [Cryptophyta sp. CCMP2293]
MPDNLAEALLSAASFGDASTQMRCMQAMSVLALQPTLHAALAHPTGQLAAGADIITPVLMVLQHESTPEDVFGVAVGLIANLCYQNFLFQERVMKSAIPVVVMMHMYTQRAGARAEGACMMAILADNEENRRHLAALCGHSGSDNFNMVECLSEVLCSQNSITDTRGLDGMRSCQAASASALACLSRFGGMDRLVHVLKDGESDVQILAASALAVIAQV